MKSWRSPLKGRPWAASHPSRGAWIEIRFPPVKVTAWLSRTPRGVRGLKFALAIKASIISGRTPRGVRGLKCLASSCALLPICTSHPSRGAWIEIQRAVFCQDTEKSHPSRGAWIEIGQQWESGSRCGSHPSRGAWIEIVRNTTSPSIPGISRTPHGVRGLKSAAGPRPHGVCLSHPSRVRGLNCLTGAPGQFAGDAA